jgi:hypothetical protein
MSVKEPLPPQERFGFRQIGSGPLQGKWVTVDHQEQRVIDYKPEPDLAVGMCLLLEVACEYTGPVPEDPTAE